MYSNQIQSHLSNHNKPHFIIITIITIIIIIIVKLFQITYKKNIYLLKKIFTFLHHLSNLFFLYIQLKINLSKLKFFHIKGHVYSLVILKCKIPFLHFTQDLKEFILKIKIKIYFITLLNSHFFYTMHH